MRYFSAQLNFAALVVCLLAPASLLASGFPTFPRYRLGPANSVVSGDFNGDGKLDLLTLTQCSPQPCSSTTIGFVAGNGKGGFRAPVSSTIPTMLDYSGSVVLADFNGDHKSDIAFFAFVGTCPGSTECISIALGNGDGTFGSVRSYPVPSAGQLLAADLNEDGPVDLVSSYAGFGNLTMQVFLGNGNGSFRPPRSSPADFVCVLGDVNGDGKLDLIGNSIQLGNGDGTFQTPTALPGAGSCAVADFNGDGKLDLADLYNDVFFGNGDGTFQPAVKYYTPLHVAFKLFAGDFNGDGKPDLFVENVGTGAILLNTGKGRFQSAVNYQLPHIISVADFNQDGRPDVIFAGVNSASFFTVALSGPNGTLAVPRAFPPLQGPVVYTTAGDFNGDGNVDLASVGGYQFNRLLGRGDGTFSPPAGSLTGGTGTGFVAVGDLNHDGKLDVVMAGGLVFVRLGLGNGSFQNAVRYPGYGATVLAVADFNGDGNLDLAVNSTAPILLGNGDGTFRSGVNLPAGIQSLVAGDFNHDGRQDLAISTSSGVGIMLGKGDGTFQPAAVLHKGQGDFLLVADFNRDSKLDVVGVGHGPSGVVISTYLGNGDGTLQPKVNSWISTGVSGDFPVGAARADFDGDGIADLAVVTMWSRRVFVLRGDGSGKFRTNYVYYNGTSTVSLLAADLDGNGTPDLAVTSAIPGLQNAITVLLNEP